MGSQIGLCRVAWSASHPRGGVWQKRGIGDLELRLGIRAAEGDLGVTGREVVTTGARELGEITQAGGDEKIQDRALGKDCMKRRGRGRRGSCKGKKKGEGDDHFLTIFYLRPPAG